MPSPSPSTIRSKSSSTSVPDQSLNVIKEVSHATTDPTNNATTHATTNETSKPRFIRPEFNPTLTQHELPDFTSHIAKMSPILDAMNVAIEIDSQNQSDKKNLNASKPKLFD
jgi:hypothetical protein